MLSTPAAGGRFRRGGLPWRLRPRSCLASPPSSSSGGGGEPEYVLNFTGSFSESFRCSFFFLLVKETCVLMQKSEAFARGEVPGRRRQEVLHFSTEFLISRTPSDFPIVHPNSQRNWLAF